MDIVRVCHSLQVGASFTAILPSACRHLPTLLALESRHRPLTPNRRRMCKILHNHYFLDLVLLRMCTHRQGLRSRRLLRKTEHRTPRIRGQTLRRSVAVNQKYNMYQYHRSSFVHLLVVSIDRVVNQMLAQMDGAVNLEGVYVLPASRFKASLPNIRIIDTYS